MDNNEGGSTTPTPSQSNVVDLAKFKSGDRPEARQFPQADAESAPITVTPKDPDERIISVSTPDGDFTYEGYIGLGGNFLAIGDRRGRIKFAAAPGKWDYVYDITDDVVLDEALEFEDSGLDDQQ